MEHVESHTMRLLGTVPAATMKSMANRFYAGDVLYGRLRPYLNKVYRANFDGLCSAEFIVLPKTEGVDPDFLRYRLNSRDFVSFTAHLNAGDRPRVDFDQISPFEIEVPEPNEQRRIVAELETQLTRLDAGVTALKRVQANLKRYRASVLKAACEGRLVPTEADLARRESRGYESGADLLARILHLRKSQWRERGKYKDPEAFVQVSDVLVPEGWHPTTLDALIVDGPQNGLYLPKDKYGVGHPILRIDDYQIGWSRPSTQLQQVAADEETASTYLLRPGDLVINRVNSPSHLGKSIAVRQRNIPALFESNMMRARLAEGVKPAFVELYLQSVEGRRRLTARA
ncbi:MAG: hypothetical protein ACREXY_07465, partial [Gammaproteobacteria bacterium]